MKCGDGGAVVRALADSNATPVGEYSDERGDWGEEMELGYKQC